MRFFLYVWLALWLVLAKFCVLGLKLFVWQAFWQEKKDRLLDDWKFLWRKNLKIPISLSLKVIAACSFFLCVSMYLVHIQTKFHCPKFKNLFSGRHFNGPHQVQNLLRKVPETWWSSCPGGWRTSSEGGGGPHQVLAIEAIHPMGLFQAQNCFNKELV